jgi:hypothetical protein
VEQVRCGSATAEFHGAAVVKQELNVRVHATAQYQARNLFLNNIRVFRGKSCVKAKQISCGETTTPVQGKSSVVEKYEEAVCGMDLVSCALLPHMHVNHWGKSVLRTVQRRDVLNRTFSRRIEI